MMRRFCLALFVAGFGVAAGRADVRLPAIFSDHMVLQADVPAMVWGWADPGENITVFVDDQTKSTTADAKGDWSVKLDIIKGRRARDEIRRHYQAGEIFNGTNQISAEVPRSLTVKGRNTLTIQDVLIGDVWLCSGQSNMEMQVKGGIHGQVDHADEEIAAANFPQIRMFIFRQTYSIYDLPAPPDAPLKDRDGAWVVCSPQTVAQFSAAAYFFGRDLFHALGTPIGLINSSVGGTPIEAWTSLAAQRTEPALQPVLGEWQQKLSGYDPEGDQHKFLEAKTAWLKQRAAAQKAGEPIPKAPLPFKNLRVSAPGGLYDGMIAPLIPYALRGVIWYQGERNADDKHGAIYGTQLRALIRDWRARWNADFYFAWVQLPRFKPEQRTPIEPNGWGVGVREGMRLALSEPHTGMAITIDLGAATVGHPTNKADFAHRLALLALHDVYELPVNEWSGPLYQSATVAGNRMIIAFDHATGLKPASGDLQGFAIAGRDRKFVWANAEITGDKVAVWTDRVSEPVALRYGWAANPIGNLVNAANLPASPFRTDDWIDEPARASSAQKTATTPAPAPPAAASPAPVAAAKPTPNFAGQFALKLQETRQIVYKHVGDRELHLFFFEPQAWKATDHRPCFVGIHGGGWTSGAPRSMYSFVVHGVEQGMVGVSVEYRLYKAGTDVSVFECVKDVRSAVRYVRAHAAEFGIDPQKIIVSGASAGGHLAVATELFPFDEGGDDLNVSCAPNALVLLSPVIDTSSEGYGNAKIGGRWQELSPAHQVHPDMPPTIIFHGTGDTTTPYLGAQRFEVAMQRAGNHCELVTVEGAPHTYMFKDATLHTDTLKRMDVFLTSLGFLPSNVTP